MNYRPFGRTGIKVSPFCLGAMMFGAIGNPDHEECTRIIHKALDAGINFIDTADVYNKGESEEIVGKALKGRRQSVVVGTKVSHPVGKDPNQQGSSRSGSHMQWKIRYGGSKPTTSTCTRFIDRRLIPISRKLCRFSRISCGRVRCGRPGRQLFLLPTSSRRSGSQSGAGSPAFVPNNSPTRS
jgi:hypothetical protein